jgi:ribosome biogenesis protein BMS1
MADTKGPITCIAGKRRRVTFFECPVDMYSMNDLAKTADLVLLMVNASYGFSMDTFEFLNMLQLHGFPKVMGVFTHLDAFKANKTLQNTKKALKQRFWTEIYKGAKMFEFSGVINGKYLKHEVKRLSLYISRVKFRPLVWRNTHPYMVCDRIEDVTPVSRLNENPLCKRDISLFGYVRGTHLKPNMKVHLIGVGDYDIHSLIALDDPCPLPGSQKIDKQQTRTSLKVKESLLYAPMANVGRVQILDKDGMYINLKNVHYTKKEMLHIGDKEGDENMDAGEETSNVGIQQGRAASQTPMELLKSMQDIPRGYDELIKGSSLSLFKGSQSIQVQIYFLSFILNAHIFLSNLSSFPLCYY